MPIQVSRPGELTCEHAAGYGTPINRIRSTFFAFRRAEKIIMLRAVRVLRQRKPSHLIFYSSKTVIKHNCVQSSHIYRYNKMLWRQIVNDNNDIGSYKTQQSVHVHTHIHTIKCYGDKCIDI